MKRILVDSDVHGAVSRLRWLLKHETADAMFFLGDGLTELTLALEDVPVAYPIYRVRGNCDLYQHDPFEGLVPLEGVLFFYTHGHLYNVKLGTDRLSEAAAARGADVALYGHTHVCCHYLGKPGEPPLFNPGSLRDTRSYGVIEVENGVCQFNWAKAGVDE